MLFSTWTREKCLTWINHLEEQIALGAISISNPDTGSTTVSRKDAIQTIRALYARLAVIDGTPQVNTGFATFVPRIHRDR